MNNARVRPAKAGESETSQASEDSPPKKRFGERLKRMLLSPRWLIIPPIAIGILVVVMMVSSKKEIPRVEVPEQTVKVAVVEAQFEYIQTSVVGYGTALPASSWTAISEVGGRIDWIHPSLESGNWIEEGATLVKIDDRDYQLRLAQRRADLSTAKASLDELNANEKADQKSLKIETDLQVVSQKDLQRMQRLRRANAVSVSELDAAQSNLLKQNQQVQRLENALTLYPSKAASARARISMAEAAVAESLRNVERTEIKSPFRGVLSGVDIEVGQIVAPNQQLFIVQDNYRVEIEAQISLGQLSQLVQQPDDGTDQSYAMQWLEEARAEIRNQSGSKTFNWVGTPVRMTETVDAQTRTIGIVVEVINDSLGQIDSTNDQSQPQTAVPQMDKDPEVGLTSVETPNTFPETWEQNAGTPLKPGTFCEVQLIGKQLQRTMALPRTAFDGDQVYVVDSNDRLQVRSVVRGSGVGDRVIVQSGIQPGERVIVRPPVPAIEGMRVRFQ